MKIQKVCRATLGAGVVAAALCSIPAQAVTMTTVIPGLAGIETTEQSGGDSSPLGGDKYPWRFQLVYGAPLLAGLQVGDIITGLTFRLDIISPDGSGSEGGFSTGGQNTNLPAQTINNYEIKLGRSANAPGALDGDFADNYTGDITTVRTGQLVINPGDFVGGGADPVANPFGAMIGFNAGSYTYTGGPLLIEIAQDSFTAAYVPGAGQPGRFVDDVNTGMTGLAQQIFGFGFGATAAEGWAFEDQALVVQLQFERGGLLFGPGPGVELPEPSGVNLFGAALACLMGVTVAGRRRKLEIARAAF